MGSAHLAREGVHPGQVECTHNTQARCMHVGQARCTSDTHARCEHPGRVHPWQIGHAWPKRVHTFAGVGVHHGLGGEGGFTCGSWFAKYILQQSHNRCDHTSVSALDPIRTP